MNNPIRQHYVPQTYLRNFALKLDKEWHIDVYDKKHKINYLADIKDIAFKKNMYTIHGADDPYKWERKFSKTVEPLMKRTFDTILAKSSNILLTTDVMIINTALQDNLIDIIWSQLFRTPKGMETIEIIASKELPLYLKSLKAELFEVASTGQKELLSSITVNEIMKMESILYSSQTIPRGHFVRNLLHRMTWVVYRIPKAKDVTFHTGDHPICIYHPSTKKQALLEIGIADPENVIFYPFNPQTLLAIYGVNHFSLVANSFNGKCQRLKLCDSVKFVEFVNKIIEDNCIQHIYSCPNVIFQSKSVD